MNDWIQALSNTSKKEVYPREMLSGQHTWYVCSHARPTFCNICGESLNGVTSHGLSCEICKYKSHKRCSNKAPKNCKWTTLASIGSKEIIEDEERNICMPHQWIEGNLPVNAKCSSCDRACGSVLRMQDFRCLWCKSYVHSHCKENFTKRCDLGACHASILPPTHVSSITSDGFLQASKAPNSSPLVVFVNSKSGDNQGVKFLRKFKQLLNPFQVFDLILGGPVVGLKLFQKFDCFRVLVCGGDGSVGWVLKEIDNLNLHKQCQIGVLPLGTGNDLARVLGWGAALDDDSQLPKLLETFERATTKMLDRWSVMTYEMAFKTKTVKIDNNNNNNINNTNAKNTTNDNNNIDSELLELTKNNNIPMDDNSDSNSNFINALIIIEEEILYNLNNLLQNDSILSVIESSKITQTKLNDLLHMIESEKYLDESKHDNSEISNLIHEQSILLKNKLEDLFLLLTSELKPSFIQRISEKSNRISNNLNGYTNINVQDQSSSSLLLTSKNALNSYADTYSLITHSSTSSNSCQDYDSDEINQNEECKETFLKRKSSSFNNNKHSFLYRKFKINKISKRFRNRRKILLKANSFKRLLKQLIQLAESTYTSKIYSKKSSLKSNENLDEFKNRFQYKLVNNLNGNNINNINSAFNFNSLSPDNVNKYEFKKRNSLKNGSNSKASLDNDYYNDESEINIDENIYNNSNNNNNNSSFFDSKNKKNFNKSNNNIHYSHLIESSSREISSNSLISLYNNNTSTNNKSIRPNKNIPILVNEKESNCLENEYVAEKNKEIEEREDASISPVKLNKRINELILNGEINRGNPFMMHSVTSNSINKETILKSPSSLTINKGYPSFYSNVLNDNYCPLASEEQSCMSTPNTTKLSPSFESISKHVFSNSGNSPLSRPNQLSLKENSYNRDTISIKILSPSNEPSLNSFVCDFDLKSQSSLYQNDYEPEIKINDGDNHNNNPNSNMLYNTRVHSSQSQINHLNSDKIDSLTLSTKLESKSQSNLLTPISSNFINLNNLNISSSSNNLSWKYSDYGSTLDLPPSPSGYSSSGSCFNKSPLPSPRISKKYLRSENKNYLQLPGKGLLTALSVSSLRYRSRSKSTDKSSSPTSPSTPKFSFKYRQESSFGFIGQALLFNAEALCAPVTPPVINEHISELYTEKTVMNNYFGIGIDAKLCLEFHLTREEHPEKCRSRIRNHMLYGLLGSKELVQRTYKNLEQKVLLECDGTKIPLKNVQGIVVLNIPSYTGGVNFWGQNSKDEDIFIQPSFDDKVLEVVAITGAVQMALSRVVSLKSNRIAQCKNVKIQILGQEGVPIQVDGEAWIQPPGLINLVHKNRAQMLTRNKLFEHTLKTWSEKQKNDPNLSSSMTKEEFAVLQLIVDDSISLIKRIKTASLRNSFIEQDLYGYATQASSNLEEINFNGKIHEKILRQQVTDFLNSIRTLHVETTIFINEKSSKLRIEQDIIEKIQQGLNDLKRDMKKLNDCHGIYQFPFDNIENEFESKPIGRFNIVQRYKKSKLKHKDDKELLKTLHSISIEEWGIDEVCLWLESLNLSEYKSAFIKHDIRGTEIRNLERRDLRELGIVKVGHIKRILNASKDIPKKLPKEKKSV